MMKIKMVAAALGFAMVASAPAQAQFTSVSPNCDWLSATSPLTFPGFVPTPYACFGAFAGNSDMPSVQGDITTFLNSQSAAITRGSTFSLNESYLAGFDEAPSGTIDFSQSVGGVFALALKGSNQFSIYLFDVATPINSLDFVMNGVALTPGGPMNPQDLSNVSMWLGTGGTNPFCVGDNCFPTSVPEPSSLAMMFVGLVGVGAAARRRRRSA